MIQSDPKEAHLRKRRNWAYAIGTAVHIAMLLYGEWQDANMALPFTDVDYYVFTDASRHVLQNRSPYDRHTYRYTPILAWLLTPCIFLHFSFGKILFVAANIYISVLLEKILLLLRCTKSMALNLSLMWLFYPISISIAARGSLDSVLCLLVLMLLYELIRKRYTRAALLLGLSVHMKIYPFVFALPCCLYITYHEVERKAISNNNTLSSVSPPSSPTLQRAISPDKVHNKKQGKSSQLSAKEHYLSQVTRLLNSIGVCKESVIFGIQSLSFFIGLTALCYVFYGYEFLYETYLYHFVRKDNRHNFSAYFYPLYLTFNSSISKILSLAVFVPQMLSCFAVGALFAKRRIEVAFFLQVLIFVAFNKVCTAQYFLWWQSLLPLMIHAILPNQMSRTESSVSITSLSDTTPKETAKDASLQKPSFFRKERRNSTESVSSQLSNASLSRSNSSIRKEQTPSVFSLPSCPMCCDYNSKKISFKFSSVSSLFNSIVTICQRIAARPLSYLLLSFVIWVITQLLWLYYAYQLEMLGKNTFNSIFACGVLFFLSNIFLACVIMISTCNCPMS